MKYFLLKIKYFEINHTLNNTLQTVLKALKLILKLSWWNSIFLVMFVETKMITDTYYSIGLTNSNQSVISFDRFLLCSEQESCSVAVATI